MEAKNKLGSLVIQEHELGNYSVMEFYDQLKSIPKHNFKMTNNGVQNILDQLNET